MAVLSWGAAGSKYIERGVDRVVVYTPENVGVPWRGVTSIDETVVGADINPIYVGGVKIMDFVENADFQLVLSAFSSPAEFRPCNGMTEIQKGLLVTQQPRKFFGLCYRTKISNELGVDAYRLHIVYNALATSAPRTSKTKSDNSDVSPLSWTFDTVPPAHTSKKPTAHISISSLRYPATIAALENILYGTVSTAPRLPTQSEVKTTIGV